jgi:DEAD/DEAH box helicase domain-containing protein
MKISEFIEELKEKQELRDLVHHEILPKSSANFAEPKRPMNMALKKALKTLHIEKLYSHQAHALDIIRDEKNLVVMTPTSSGKSLIYNIPVLESIIEAPTARALYIFPLKGLEQDQLRSLNEVSRLLKLKNTAEIYDGDTTQYRRSKIRENPPNIIITNPDMLHLGILAYHEKWPDFFKNLKYVVIDELHTYRGVLGSHVAQVIRRLRRIAALHGSRPKFISCSATIANPLELATTLTGEEFELIDKSGAPEGRKHFLMVNPIPLRSPYSTATRLFTLAIASGFKSIAFTRSRKVTELMHNWASERAPMQMEHVSTYRAGYLPEERRDIEQRLFKGELQGVISTSALELGVDIGGLDVCILAGYPGTISSTWQRAGRVGRSGRDSLIILIATEDALDQYFMRNPDDFFGRSVEAAVLDAANRPILKAHLPCAVAERPFIKSSKDSDPGFDITRIEPVLNELTKEQKIWYSRIKQSYNPKQKYPQRHVSIRGTGTQYNILTMDKKPLATSDSTKVLRELHPGAIYLHRGKRYQVRSLHLGLREVLCAPSTAKYHTSPMIDEETEILSTESKKRINSLEINYSTLRITERVMGYRKKELSSKKIISEHTLELPPRIFTTKGIWMEIGAEELELLDKKGFSIAGSLHALEHSAIATLPLFALCDRMDLGGTSYTLNPELGVPAIFIYDAHDGGIGLTQRGFHMTEEWFASTIRLMSECSCEVSCPSCTQDPHCGNNNEPLDKRGALVILKQWIESS